MYLRYVDVAFIDIGDPRHLVQVIYLWAVGIVRDNAVLQVADAQNLVQRLAIGKFHHREVKLAPADEIDRRTFLQRFVGGSSDRRSDECDLDLGIGLFDGFGHFWSPVQPGVLVNKTRNS